MTTRTLSIRVFLRCLVPITLWAFSFFLIYAAQTLACVLPTGAPRMGIWVAPMVVSAMVALGAGVFAVRRSRLEDDRDEARSFLAKTTMELAGLAMLATIWIVLAGATMSACVAPW